jgi:hypothetical protein
LVDAPECDLHQKIPSSFPKKELQMAHIFLPQINVSLSSAMMLSFFEQLPGTCDET